MIESREWLFRVSCRVEEGETVCVVGNDECLGSWDSQRVVPLCPEGSAGGGGDEGGDGVWSAALQVPLAGVEYRYCVCIILDARPGMYERIVVVRRWETNILPRRLLDGVTCPVEPQVECFGVYGAMERVDQGWLVKDTAVQLRLCPSSLYNDPVMLFKKKYQDKKVRVKVTPVDQNAPTPPQEGVGVGGVEESTEFDLSNLRLNTKPMWPLMEVAVMKTGQCEFRSQEQFGVECNNGDYVVFQSRMMDHNTNMFLCDFYLDDDEDIPKYLGCSYILPSNLKENFGVTTLPITSPKHAPIGQLTVHYMVVYPMAHGGDMSVSYARYWKDSWKGLEVGHRGAGTSYHSEPKSCANIRENTIASLKYAAEKGADMVEFDVQLSKDLVPVIYHDFHACIALKRKKEQNETDLLEIPIKDLTLQQLQTLKVYHKKEQGLSRFEDDDFEDHQPFPTLQKALEVVPCSCGFNVEVKWTMRLRDGTYELRHPFELNHFLDLIIKMILEHSNQRKIVFSCFHPDICTMLRLKQNRYPVMFLTQGVSEVWPPYEDLRTSTVQQAIFYAINANILGININTEDLMRDPSQVRLALEQKLVVFCWGDLNNDQENIKFLKKVGLHGIIYDKIDVYNTKDKKESVFLCEEKEAADQLVRGDKKEEEEEEGNTPPISLPLSPLATSRGLQGGSGTTERPAYSGVRSQPTTFTGILSN